MILNRERLYDFRTACENEGIRGLVVGGGGGGGNAGLAVGHQGCRRTNTFVTATPLSILTSVFLDVMRRSKTLLRRA